MCKDKLRYNRIYCSAYPGIWPIRGRNNRGCGRNNCFECFDVLLAHIAGPPGAVPPPPRYADHTWYVARLSDTSRRENPDLFPENLLFSVERNRVVVGSDYR